jgi:hypothetical protein
MVKLFSKACVAYDLKSGQYVRKDFSAVELSDEQNNIYLILNPEDKTKENYPSLAIIFKDFKAYSYAIDKTLDKNYDLKFKLTNGRYFDDTDTNNWAVLGTPPSSEVSITDDQFEKIYRKQEADLESYLVEDPINILKECGGTGQTVLETLKRLEKGTQNQTGFYGFFKWIYWYGALDKQAKIRNKISELKPKNESDLKAALNSSGDLFHTINAKRHGFAFNLHRYFFYKNTSKSMAIVQSSLNFYIY